jgi:hypothetical protein
MGDRTVVARFLSLFPLPDPPQSKTSPASVLGSMKPTFNSCILGFAGLISEQVPYDPNR